MQPAEPSSGCVGASPTVRIVDDGPEMVDESLDAADVAFQVLVIYVFPFVLMTAVQLKLRDPDAVVTVLEKHAIYTRAHVLDLRPSSFLGIPTAAEPSLASKIVQQTPART